MAKLNPSKLFEQALTALLRNSNLGPGVTLRPWQSIPFDGSWNADEDYTLPMVDIRFASESIGEDQVTCVCTGNITAITKTDDDQDHAAISALYDAVYGVVAGIFKSFIFVSGTQYSEFLAKVEELSADTVHIGGVELVEPSMPSSIDGRNEISIGLAVHFTYI